MVILHLVVLSEIMIGIDIYCLSIFLYGSWYFIYSYKSFTMCCVAFWDNLVLLFFSFALCPCDLDGFMYVSMEFDLTYNLHYRP